MERDKRTIGHLQKGFSLSLKQVFETGEINLVEKYFEDLFDGERLCCDTIEMTKERILSFAREFDPQPFHISEKLAEASMFKGLIASSLHTLSACTRVVVNALEGVEILSGVGMEAVKMKTPVRPGDILQVDAWWTNLNSSETRPGYGFGTVKCQVVNQKNESVIEYGYQYIIRSVSTKQ